LKNRLPFRGRGVWELAGAEAVSARMHLVFSAENPPP
jgi:hypothetical protein